LDELRTRRIWQGHKGFDTGSDLQRVKPYVQCAGIVWKVISPRMELYAALYARRSRVSIRGWWTLIGVGYRYRKVAFHNCREDPVILGSTGGAATVI
jgi:hypothetical protein